MRGLVTNQPALNYLDVTLRARIAAVRARAEGEGEERQFGASAVEWVVITTIVLVIVVAAGIVISGAIQNKTTNINACIQGAGNGKPCAP